jgi:hypothetical protein
LPTPEAGVSYQTILGVCLGAWVVAVAAYAAHRRLAGPGERPGCASMLAFVAAWLAVLTALITGAFLLVARPGSG